MENNVTMKARDTVCIEQHRIVIAQLINDTDGLVVLENLWASSM